VEYLIIQFGWNLWAFSMGNSDHPVRIPINPIKNPIFIDTLARMRIISTKFFFQKMQKSPKNIHSI